MHSSLYIMALNKSISYSLNGSLTCNRPPPHTSLCIGKALVTKRKYIFKDAEEYLLVGVALSQPIDELLDRKISIQFRYVERRVAYGLLFFLINLKRRRDEMQRYLFRRQEWDWQSMIMRNRRRRKTRGKRRGNMSGRKKFVPRLHCFGTYLRSRPAALFIMTSIAIGHVKHISIAQHLTHKPPNSTYRV